MEILWSKPSSLDCIGGFPWKEKFSENSSAWNFSGRKFSGHFLNKSFWSSDPQKSKISGEIHPPALFLNKNFDHLHKIWILCNNKMFLKLVARSYLLCLMDPFRHSLSCQQKVPSQINFSQFFYPSHFIFLTIFFALKRQVCWQKGGFPNLRCETKKIANLRPLCFPPNPLSRK